MRLWVVGADRIQAAAIARFGRGPMGRLWSGPGWVGFALGGLYGGLLHLVLVGWRADEVLRRSGIERLYWNIRPVGETIASLFILYLFPAGLGVVFALIWFGLNGLADWFLRQQSGFPRGFLRLIASCSRRYCSGCCSGQAAPLASIRR